MGYIFESEIEMIMNAVRANTIGEAESIRLKEILAANLHPALKAYFKARVWQLLQQERLTEARSKRFPYQLPEVIRLQDQIDVILVHNYEFAQHDFTLMLDHAVHFQFNFLCRPQWTLLNFIFENQRRRPTSEIQRKLRYCVDYEYYSEIIRRYIVDRGLAEMTYEEFSDLLEKLDEEIVSRHSSVELALMTRPIVQFIEYAKPRTAPAMADAEIPINAAIVFFEDKKINAIKERLELDRDREGVLNISLRRLANIIEKVRSGNEAAEAIFPEEHQAENPAVEPPKMEPAVQDQPPEPKDSKPPIMVFSDFVEDQPVARHDKIADELPGQATEFDEAEMVEGGLVNLHSLFTPSEEKTFIKKVFRKDELLFRATLDQINQMTEWQTAARYLQEMFVTNEVDPFSEEAILFTDKIQKRFLPGDDQSQERA